MKRYAVIIAGGAGERFWPLSRIDKPKHLWNIAGGEKCLLSQTFARAAKIVPMQNVFVLTSKTQYRAILETCTEISDAQIFCEPFGRDTTAAIGVAALLVEKAAGEDASFAVLPSDHLIEDDEKFSATLLQAFEIAESGDTLTTVGINPTFPATGYGYIRRGKKFALGGDAFDVSRFFEKPNLKRATEYLESGEFFWNAGMFVWKTSTILSALKRDVPDTFKVLLEIKKRLCAGADFTETLENEYPKVEKISIDFSVMEKAKNAKVVPARFDWDDVGSWAAVERHCMKDENSTAVMGETFALDSSDCVVFDAAGRATALLGVKDLIVVHSKDATLVCRRDCAERLKELVKTLPQRFR